MQQLTGMDASWLILETPSTPMHIGVVNVFERPDDSNFSPSDAARAQLASKVPSIEPLRRRLVDVPLRVGRPYWVMDPDFDIDAHIRHHDGPLTTDEELADLAGQIMTEPLDRRRPMWEAHVVDDIGDNRWALITKYHHATIDGGAGILLAHLLFDSDPDARPTVPPVLVPDAEADPWKNMISMLIPSVVVNEADPLIRFEKMRQSMSAAKAQLRLAPDDLIDDVAALAPASMMSAATHLASRLRLAERVGSPANLTISNVAGPRSPLYISGSRLLNLTPLSLLADGAGLNITVLSCGDAFDIGLTSCPQAVPDLQFMLDCILDEIDHLFEISGATR